MADQYYIGREGKTLGPFSAEQLWDLTRRGQLQPTDVVWKEGTKKRVPAARIRELFPVTAAETHPSGVKHLGADVSHATQPPNSHTPSARTQATGPGSAPIPPNSPARLSKRPAAGVKRQNTGHPKKGEGWRIIWCAVKAGGFVGISVALTSIVCLCYYLLDLRQLDYPTTPHGGGRGWQQLGFVIICVGSLFLGFVVALPAALLVGTALRWRSFWWQARSTTEQQPETVGTRGNVGKLLKVGLLLIPVALTLLCWLWVFRTPPHPAPDPKLSEPPRLLTPAEIAGGHLLIDGKGLSGWSVDGVSAIRNDNLEFGGDPPTSAYLLRELPTEFTLNFDFFQEGPGRAEFHLKEVGANIGLPVRSLASAQVVDLNLTGYQKYKRWHRCTITATHEKDAYDLRSVVVPIAPGYGKTITGGHLSYGGERPRYFAGFELASGSRLYLRNLTVAEEPGLDGGK